MELKKVEERALEIRELYRQLEMKKYGREWTAEEIGLGFVGDVGDLMKLLIAKSGVRAIAEVDSKLEHELSDCLWSVLILARMYNIDIEKVFSETMDQLELKVGKLLSE